MIIHILSQGHIIYEYICVQKYVQTYSPLNVCHDIHLMNNEWINISSKIVKVILFKNNNIYWSNKGRTLKKTGKMRQLMGGI